MLLQQPNIEIYKVIKYNSTPKGVFPNYGMGLLSMGDQILDPTSGHKNDWTSVGGEGTFHIPL